MLQTSKRKTKYHLYACDVCAENVEIAQQERFNRLTPKYGLVYTRKKIKDWPEITNDNVAILTSADRRWLFECNMLLITEQMGKDDFGVDIKTAIEELEQALIKEKEMLNDGKDGFKAGDESD